MRRRAIIPFVPYLVISVVHCLLIIFQLPGRGYETKQLLMPALALAVVWSLWGVRPWPKSAAILMLAALTTSWLGDGAGLFFPTLPTLPMMIACFALAHIAYIVLFWRAPQIGRVRRLPWWVVVYALWWVVLLAVIGPAAGSLFFAVAVYGVVLGATAALSPCFGGTVALGGAFFLLSDSVLAFKEFLEAPALLGNLVIMPAYTLGQGLIVFGTVALLKSAAGSEASCASVEAQNLPQ